MHAQKKKGKKEIHTVDKYVFDLHLRMAVVFLHSQLSQARGLLRDASDCSVCVSLDPGTVSN